MSTIIELLLAKTSNFFKFAFEVTKNNPALKESDAFKNIDGLSKVFRAGIDLAKTHKPGDEKYHAGLIQAQDICVQLMNTFYEYFAMLSTEEISKQVDDGIFVLNKIPKESVNPDDLHKFKRYIQMFVDFKKDFIRVEKKEKEIEIPPCEKAEAVEC